MRTMVAAAAALIFGSVSAQVLEDATYTAGYRPSLLPGYMALGDFFSSARISAGTTIVWEAFVANSGTTPVRSGVCLAGELPWLWLGDTRLRRLTAVRISVLSDAPSEPEQSAMADGTLCVVCHKRTNTLLIPCTALDYRRHLDHGDRPEPCGFLP